MAKNKIIYGNETLIDLTNDTVSPNNLLLGETAHDRSGEPIQGNVVVPTVNDSEITIQKNGVDVDSFTLNQSTDKTINITILKSDVGLNNVPNVSTNDQTPTFTEASTRTNIASGEKLSVILGKIKKFFTDLKAVAFSGSYNDLSDQPAIPTKVSDLQNDSGFIDNTVNNLANYYLKTETYTQTEVNALIGAITTISFLVVQSLPQTGESNIIYLVPLADPNPNNIYEEYIYINGSWELIGTTEVDLSNYYTKTETEGKIDDKINALDVTGSSNINASKTVKAWSEANGKVSITVQDIQIAESQVTNLTADLGNKVDKVSGKGLSANDYTDTEKTKVTNALPKIQNGNVSADNIASCSGGGTYSYFKIASLVISGTNQNKGPVLFELSQRRYPLSRLQIGVTGPSTAYTIQYFTTDYDDHYWLNRVDNTHYDLYGQYNEKWGFAYLHRITGTQVNRDVAITVVMQSVEDIDTSTMTQVEYGGNAGYATSAGSATTATSATTASKLGSSDVGTATNPIYLSDGIPTAGTYELKATVNNGTANRLVCYSSNTAIGNTANLTYIEANSTASTPAAKRILHIYGTCYGNSAANMISGTAGLFSYGDGGPQIDFGGQETLGSGQCGALIFTNNDTPATGASWHFVSTESDWNVTSKRFHARTAISIGTNLPPSTSSGTQYALSVTGTANITGNTTIGGTLGITGQTTGTAGDGSYHKGRDLASFKNSEISNNSRYYPVIDTKTLSGDWSIGALGNTSDSEWLYFIHTTETNYSGNTNKTRKYRLYGPTDTSDNNVYNLAYITSATDGQIMVATGTSGGIRSSGYTIAKSVPSDAVFTDTTYTATSENIGSASKGTNISADDITAWTTNTPTVVTKKTVVIGGSTTNVPNISKKTVVTSASGATASYSGGILTITDGSFSTGDSVIVGTAIKAYTTLTTGDSVDVTAGTAASLSYSSRSIPNISVTSKSVVTGIIAN